MINWKRNVAFFLIGQMISLFGSMLVQYAITWNITLNTESGFMMTIAIICGFLPAFFISPFAGVWADRYNKKILIILSDALTATATLVLAILFLTGYGSIYLLFGISVIRSFGQGIQSPTISAYLPHLVPEEQLMKINSLTSTIQPFLMIVSPILSGVLLTFATIEAIFFIDVITALLAILIILLFIKENVKTKEGKDFNQVKPTYFGDLVCGIKYIFSHQFVKRFVSFNAVFLILVGPLSFLTPLQVTRNFGGEYWKLTAIEISFSVGMILGGFIIGTWGGFKNKFYSMVTSNFIIALCTIALGIVPFFYVYLGFLLLCGLVLPLFNVPATVLIQSKVDKEYLGRVFGVFNMVSSIMMPLGMLLFGPLSDKININYLLIATGILMLILSFIMTSSKVMIEAGKPNNIVNENNK